MLAVWLLLRLLASFLLAPFTDGELVFLGKVIPLVTKVTADIKWAVWFAPAIL